MKQKVFSKRIIKAIQALIDKETSIKTEVSLVLSAGSPIDSEYTFGDEVTDHEVMVFQFNTNYGFLRLVHDVYNPDVNNDEPQLVSSVTVSYHSPADFIAGIFIPRSAWGL